MKPRTLKQIDADIEKLNALMRRQRAELMDNQEIMEALLIERVAVINAATSPSESSPT